MVKRVCFFFFDRYEKEECAETKSENLTFFEVRFWKFLKILSFENVTYPPPFLGSKCRPSWFSAFNSSVGFHHQPEPNTPWEFLIHPYRDGCAALPCAPPHHITSAFGGVEHLHSLLKSYKNLLGFDQRLIKTKPNQTLRIHRQHLQ